MDVTNKIQAKLTKILKKLKSLGVIQTYILEINFCLVEESMKKILLEIDAVLKKCLRKIISKPREAEIRNIISELVRKKNLNNPFDDESAENTLVFQCDLCKETFNSKKNLITHQKKHKKTETYLCEKCGKLFYSIQHLLNHQSDFKDKEIILEKKNSVENNSREIFTSRINFEPQGEVQMRSKVFYESLRPTLVEEAKNPVSKDLIESQERKKTFTCACGKVFRVLKTFRKHERIKHSVIKIQHKCKICGKCFMEKGKLNRHILSHNDYQYSCSFCLKQFPRSDTLKRHISLFHFAERKFTCSFCQKTFSLKYNRDVHEDNVHKNPTNNVQCDYCGNKFRNKTTLKSHFKTHFENRITCTTCRKTFSRKTYLENHVKNKHFGMIPSVSVTL